MKKIYKVLIVMLTVVMCTACGNRTAATIDRVKDKAKDYTITDVKDDYDFAKEAIKITGNRNFRITFLELKNDVTSRRMYIDEVKNIYAIASRDILKQHKDDPSYEVKESDIDKIITTGDNFSIVEVITSETYFRIGWIDNTFIYGTVNVNSKSDLIKIMSGLGY